MTGLGVIAAGAVLGAAGVIKPGYGDDDEADRRTVLSALGEPYGWYTVSLTDEEKRLVNALYANTLFNGAGGLRSIMEGREWAQADDETRIEMVKDAKDAANLDTLRYVVKNLL